MGNDLTDLANKYHKKQLRIGGVSNRIIALPLEKKHGYLGSEMLAIKKILSLVYGC